MWCLLVHVDLSTPATPTRGLFQPSGDDRPTAEWLFVCVCCLDWRRDCNMIDGPGLIQFGSRTEKKGPGESRHYNRQKWKKRKRGTGPIICPHYSTLSLCLSLSSQGLLPSPDIIILPCGQLNFSFNFHNVSGRNCCRCWCGNLFFFVIFHRPSRYTTRMKKGPDD